MTTEPRHETEGLPDAITAPVDHEKLIADIRESIANPPDLSGLRAQLGLTDRPRRHVA